MKAQSSCILVVDVQEKLIKGIPTSSNLISNINKVVNTSRSLSSDDMAKFINNLKNQFNDS